MGCCVLCGCGASRVETWVLVRAVNQSINLVLSPSPGEELGRVASGASSAREEALDALRTSSNARIRELEAQVID